ncbi:hypothetical protein [Algoriphagus sp.]|uniref:hypothetical protein n=1 Tax=Algoriphagus sp. TaxID=1872435 RepID=UPI003919A453
MQEDKTSKWFASLLRKQQEENPLPYELGAWEAFEKKRIALARKKTAYWISGIAASLALLLVVGGLWLSNDFDPNSTMPSEQLALEEKIALSPSESAEPINPEKSEEKLLALDEENQAKEAKAARTVSTEIRVSTSVKEKPVSPKEKVPVVMQEFIPEPLQKTEISNQATVIEPSNPNINPTKPGLMQSLIAGEEKNSVEKILKTEGLKDNALTDKALPKDPELTQEEIAKILETPSSARLALGLSPGYGASQTSAQATSGSSLGLGVMVDMDIVGKLSIGSGLAVNYLNQASESQNYLQVAGFSSPVTEKNEIAQVQVDIPLYFKYPITRSQSISVQAGFSNLVTFNQTAETESSYTRQVAVFDANAAGLSNSFTLKSESASFSSALDVPQNRFFPLATANLGVNFRLLESKKTSYELMPFYNHPLQDFSGYGQKLGMFGASFKVNFGTIQR